MCDGIEVFNLDDDESTNSLAYDDAIRLNKMMMSGGDIHTSSCSRIGKSGIAFPRRICTNEDLVNALRSCDLRLIINGEITK